MALDMWSSWTGRRVGAAGYYWVSDLALWLPSLLFPTLYWPVRCIPWGLPADTLPCPCAWLFRVWWMPLISRTGRGAGAVSLGWTPCGIGRHALLELCGSPWVGVAAVPLGLRIAFCLLASAVLVDLYRVFRLSCMVLSQNTGVLSLLVFAIGCGVSGLLSSCHLINTFCYMFEL